MSRWGKLPSTISPISSQRKPKTSVGLSSGWTLLLWGRLALRTATRTPPTFASSLHCIHDRTAIPAIAPSPSSSRQHDSLRLPQPFNLYQAYLYQLSQQLDLSDPCTNLPSARVDLK
jgi:hypothetical protein